jgi:spermidine/putrescine transport system ATP-binding protein
MLTGKPMTVYDVELIHVTKEFPIRGKDGTPIRAVDDVSLQIPDGEFFALLGPSGCGKTTTLRMIAGFEDTTSGQILIRGKPVQDVPPFHRPVNTVFQDYALFPHMTVLKNVMFGVEMEGASKHVARERAMRALELVQLPHAADRKPRQLSGGQQQRVALARALVKEPAVLLLDEPLGALDLKLRKAMQFELKAMQKQLGITFIFVTHDQEEAMTMADRIAVMDRGKVLQIGTPEEIYETPATEFVADFIGETNFLRGMLVARQGDIGTIRLDDQVTFCATLGDPNTPLDRGVTVAIRPERINLFPTEGPAKSYENPSLTAPEFKAILQRDPDINLIEGVIQQQFYIGTDTRYVVRIGRSAEVIVRAQNYGSHVDTVFRDGQRVNVFWDTENARVLTS